MHSAARKNILALSYNNATLAAAVQTEHRNSLYLGATARSLVPRSQVLAKLSDQERSRLDPEVLARLEKEALPPTDDTPPLGSVSYTESSRSAYFEKVKRSAARKDRRHSQGLNDWKWYDAVGGDPLKVAQERIRRRAIVAVDPVLQSASRIYDYGNVNLDLGKLGLGGKFPRKNPWTNTSRS